jgi:hypothetical protein
MAEPDAKSDASLCGGELPPIQFSLPLPATHRTDPPATTRPAGAPVAQING